MKKKFPHISCNYWELNDIVVQKLFHTETVTAFNFHYFGAIDIAIMNRVFHSLYKIGRNGNFVFKGFNNSKKKVTSSGARPDATDYYWFRSPVPNHMS